MLEAGCGEGYGADLLAEVADRVVALDYDEPSVGARARPLSAGWPSCAANLAVLPVRVGRAWTWWRTSR